MRLVRRACRHGNWRTHICARATTCMRSIDPSAGDDELAERPTAQVLGERALVQGRGIPRRQRLTEIPARHSLDVIPRWCGRLLLRRAVVARMRGRRRTPMAQIGHVAFGAGAERNCDAEKYQEPRNPGRACDRRKERARPCKGLARELGIDSHMTRLVASASYSMWPPIPSRGRMALSRRLAG